MTRAATDEQVRDRAMGGVVASLPACSPTNHFELVVVASTNDVAARIGQALYNIAMTTRGGPVHRVSVVALLAGVHIEPALQQQINGADPSIMSSSVQQRPLVRLSAGVQLLGVRVEKRCEPGNVALSGRLEELPIDRGRRLMGLFVHRTAPFLR